MFRLQQNGDIPHSQWFTKATKFGVGVCRYQRPTSFNSISTKNRMLILKREREINFSRMFFQGKKGHHADEEEALCSYSFMSFQCISCTDGRNESKKDKARCSLSEWHAKYNNYCLSICGCGSRKTYFFFYFHFPQFTSIISQHKACRPANENCCKNGHDTTQPDEEAHQREAKINERRQLSVYELYCASERYYCCTNVSMHAFATPLPSTSIHSTFAYSIRCVCTEGVCEALRIFRFVPTNWFELIWGTFSRQ